VTALLLPLYLLVIAFVTLTPRGDLEHLTSGRGFLLCLFCGQQVLVDTLLNIALFIPYGMLLRALGLRMRNVILVTALTSLGIELLQWGVIPGRQPQLRDLLANWAGGALGGLLASHWRVLAVPTPRQAGRLAAGSASIWVLHLIFTSWALTPSPSIAFDHYWVQWTHDFPHTQPFRGSVLDATLNDRPIRDGPYTDVHVLERELRHVPSMLKVSAVGALPTSGRSQIVAIANERYQVALRLQQVGCDFEYKVRLRAANFGLNHPALRLAAPCRSGGEEPILFSGRLDSGGLTLSARDNATFYEGGLSFTPNLGWSLLPPFEFAFTDPRPASFAWITSLLSVIAFWAGNAAQWKRAILALVATVVTSLLSIPLYFGFDPVSWTEWVAATLAVIVGLAAVHVAAGQVRGSPDAAS
jgi:hypothetical protein